MFFAIALSKGNHIQAWNFAITLNHSSLSLSVLTKPENMKDSTRGSLLFVFNASHPNCFNKADMADLNEQSLEYNF